jgi:hypothetical protein
MVEVAPGLRLLGTLGRDLEHATSSNDCRFRGRCVPDDLAGVCERGYQTATRRKADDDR